MVFNLVEQIRITNPFYSYFFAYFILRCWKEYALQIRKKARHFLINGKVISSESSSSSSDDDDSDSSSSESQEKTGVIKEEEDDE
jgi:hypothetical protein